MSHPSLYIHIPFCHRKCFYCSFAVSIGQEARRGQYIKCLLKEAKEYEGMAIETVYIGGGTPSYLTAEQIENFFDLIRTNFQIKKNAEITFELNPEDVDPTKLKIIKELGINRLSLGVQTFYDGHLKYLGRNHDAKKANEAYDLIRKMGFHNVNVDLMFSFPQQTPEELREDVQKVLALKADHISLYSLTVEEKSRFYAKNVRLADGTRQADDFLFIIKELEKNGFRQYEISNFAKEGFESRHNLNYWVGGNYIGLGVGAHSHVDGHRFWNTSNMFEYMKRIEAHTPVKEGEEFLNPSMRLMELVLFGLRMREGVNLKEAEEKSGVRLDKEKLDLIDDFVSHGLLKRKKDVIEATLKGKLVLDEISARLV